MRPTPTAEVMKTHIHRWTRKNYFHLWFRDHNVEVLNVLSCRACKRMRYIKDNQDDIVTLLNKKGESMTVEKLIRRNHKSSLHEYYKKFWLFVE